MSGNPVTGESLTIFDITDDKRAVDIAQNYGLTRDATYTLRTIPTSALKVPLVDEIADMESVAYILTIMEANPADLPPIVVEGNDTDGYDPIDGHHRGSALRSLKVDFVDAWVADPDE